MSRMRFAPNVIATARSAMACPRVVNGHASRPREGRRQCPSQPRSLREQPHMYASHMPDLPFSVSRHRQTACPLTILHVKGAPTRSSTRS